MKIGRNAPCPCNSGKKYKKCCLRKSEEQRLAEALMEASAAARKKGHIKQCLHPKKDECSETIIKAHAIQNNKILNRISENGCLITLDGISNLMFQAAQSKGRKTTTIFTGFCSHHDKVLFQEIEDREFTATPKQIFLLTYRTMAWHYHKKQEDALQNQLLRQLMTDKGFPPRFSEENSLLLEGISLGLSDNETKKNIFDKALLSCNYEIVDSLIWEIPYEVQIAVSMQYEPSFDLKGKRIGNYEDHSQYLRSIYLNIFPSDGKSFCVWSWLSADKDMANFARQFMDLETKDRESFLNNNLPAWTDSIVISPILWRKWGDPIQQGLIAHANFGTLYHMYEIEDGGHPYQYAETPWNLFDPKSIDDKGNTRRVL